MDVPYNRFHFRLCILKGLCYILRMLLIKNIKQRSPHTQTGKSLGFSPLCKCLRTSGGLPACASWSVGLQEEWLMGWLDFRLRGLANRYTKTEAIMQLTRWSNGKNSPANAGNAKDWLDPCIRKILSGKWQPLQYSCLENSMDTGAWRATANGFADRKSVV